MALRYDIDFEAGDFSEWDDPPDSPAYLTVSSTNPITGTYSASLAPGTSVSPTNHFARNNTNALSGLDVSVLRAGWRFNINDFAFGSNSSYRFFGLGSGSTIANTILIDGGGGVINIGDQIGSLAGTTDIGDGSDHTIEIRWQRENGTDGDGTTTYYIDGVQEVQATGLSNGSSLDGLTGETASFILKPDNQTGATGSFRVDDIIFRDDDTVIYPGGSTWDNAAMPKPCSIDADGDYIYIAALDASGQPTLIKFPTALDADGSIVFQPGGGSDIGVECSATDADTIWIAGEFGSTNTVERSTDGGGSFVVEDPGTFAPVTAFDVGPDSDERVIVAAETSGSIGLVNIFETVDGGDNWSEKNAGLSSPASVRAIGRFPTSPEELVLGNANAAADRSDYSPNSGADLDDITSGTPAADATGVIVG